MIRHGGRRTWMLVAAVAVLAGLLAAPAAATPEARAKANLIADYRFGGSVSSSVAGASDLVPTGKLVVGFFPDSVGGKTRTVLVFPKGDSLDLQNASITMAPDRYTIVILMRFDAMSGYRRVLNFYKNQRDTGLYFYDGYPYFYDQDYPYDSFGQTAANEWVQVTLTRSAGGLVKGYIDGELRFSFDDSVEHDAVIGAADVLRFFRDDGSEEAGGAVSRIRIWDKPLSASKIASLGWLVKQRLVIDPPGAVPGDTVDVTVKGFGPNENVKIKLWDSTHGWRTLGKIAVDISGQGTKTFAIPNDTSLGAQKFKAVGQTSGLKKKAHVSVEIA